MKQYSSAEALVLSLAKDCKNALQTSAQFEFSYNDIQAVITSMNNQNSSKVTIYSGAINDVSFQGSITALKKKLGIEYTKEYNRTGERAQAANTKVVIKSDEELQHTVDVSYDRLYNAVTSLLRIVNRYGLSGILNEDDICSIRNEGVICRGDDVIPVMELMMKKLKQERDEAKEAAERKEAERKEAAAKKEAEKASILQKIQDASAKGDFDLVITLSAELKKLTK